MDIKQKAKQVVDNNKNATKRIVGIVKHRFEFGSPVLFQPAEDLGLPSILTNNLRQDRIKRRRELFNMKYEEYQLRR